MARPTAIILPTLGRPHRVAPLLANIAEATSGPHRVYFVAEPHDTATIEAVEASPAELILNRGPGSYASCINTAYHATSEPFFFTGADDIRFTPGWLPAALAEMDDPAIGVVGTVDPLHEFPDQSTHSLVRRRYIAEESGCFDLPNTVLYPYHHGYCDTEFLAVAKARGAYVYCEQSRVEHHHPGWDWLGNVRSDDERYDATYAKGNSRHWEDLQTFLSRSRAWSSRLEPNSPATRSLLKFLRRNRGLRGRLRYAYRAAGDATGLSLAARRLRRIMRRDAA
ncbi:MAG: hypothetical protein AAF790_06500 [Planctomycetota bacterium]